MRQIKKRRIGVFALAIMMFVLATIPVQLVEATEDTGVKRGKISNSVSIQESYSCFIGNAEPVDVKPGKKFFLTYTVDSVEKNTLLGMGLIVTKDYKSPEIYGEGNGFMKYADKDQNLSELLEAGYTYLISFEMEEDGFHYKIAKAKGDHAEYVNLGDVGQNIISKEITDGKYFGLYLNGAELYQDQKRCLTAEFSRVYCYDEDGNDIPLVASRNATVYRPKQMTDKKVAHYYEFSLMDTTNVYISNRKEAKGTVVYLSYDVENVSKQSVAMNGFVACSVPTEEYPWNHGVLGYQDYPVGESPMLREGAHYLVRFEKAENEVKANVKCTWNGKDEYFGWTSTLFMENYDYDALNYIGIFMGQGYESFVSADFKNVRCYDEKGNNLGVQVNKKDLKISHYGELEDYSLCEAVYYCKGNRTFFFLEDESSVGKLVVGEETEWGTYSIDDSSRKMVVDVGGNQTTYTYKYTLFVDDEENQYIRMKDNKVTFISGTDVSTQMATAKNTYRVTKPENPSMKDNTFKEWCLGDGTAYDFETVVTEATTLYAKWVDGDGNEYLATTADARANGFTVSPMVISIIVSAVLIVLTGVCIAAIVRKGKKHEDSK